jgi:phosphoribosylpyrophosphate synthetase
VPSRTFVFFWRLRVGCSVFSSSHFSSQSLLSPQLFIIMTDHASANASPLPLPAPAPAPSTAPRKRPVLVYAGPGCEAMAMSICGDVGAAQIDMSLTVTKEKGTAGPLLRHFTGALLNGPRSAPFQYVPSTWKKFPDGNDLIRLGGFVPDNLVFNSHVVFCASFHSNDATMQILHSLVVLLESCIKSLTLVAPFFPFGTMERVEVEGVVATANTTAKLLSALPSCGRPIRFLTFDIHAQVIRHYFHGNMQAPPQSALPLFKAMVPELATVSYIFFPDAGAHKRFARCFPGQDTGYCEKVRRGDERVVTIVDPGRYDFEGATVMLVDDLVRTGGTLRAAAAALKARGAKRVSAYCTHAAGTFEQLMTFSRLGTLSKTGPQKTGVDTLYLTDSVPTMTERLPIDDVFVVLPLAPTLQAVLKPRCV